MAKSNPFTIGELHDLLARLEATAQSMIDGLARKRKPGRPPAAKRAPKGRRPGRKAKSNTRTRAGAAALQEKLLAVLKGGKGMQLGDIVRKAGAAAGPVQYHLRALRAKRKARVVGARQSARWFAR